MAKDDRTGLNPFTGEKHLDLLNDDNFLRESYGQYRDIVSRSNLLDNTTQGQAVTNVARRLIGAIEEYLLKIGRYDYIENYYDWEFHLVGDNNVNAFCMPGGKIVVFSGILGVADTEEKIAFILAHEISHALLDHSRTQQSARTAKTGIVITELVGIMKLLPLSTYANPPHIALFPDAISLSVVSIPPDHHHYILSKAPDSFQEPY